MTPDERKRRLSARLLELDGVSGVGIPDGRLTVYLDADSPGLRARVAAVVEKEAPGAPPEFVVTGRLRG